VASFPHLLAPGRIGAMAVRNRLVMSPMETMYGTPDGLPSQRTRDYFAARAGGGVGLITLGATGVDNHHPETSGGLHDTLSATMPDAEVHAAGDCSGLGLIRKATEEGARAACAI
jgi:2,4-dienoyl-CoA reductase-like NADH-dependent reductase (Old Yellow Enzyme family)